MVRSRHIKSRVYIALADFCIVQSLDSNAFGVGAVLGCDFVGVVEETGSDVTRITKGTTVAGLIWGGEYQVRRCDVLIRVF